MPVCINLWKKIGHFGHKESGWRSEGSKALSDAQEREALERRGGESWEGCAPPQRRVWGIRSIPCSSDTIIFLANRVLENLA